MRDLLAVVITMAGKGRITSIHHSGCPTTTPIFGKRLWFWHTTVSEIFSTTQFFKVSDHCAYTLTYLGQSTISFAEEPDSRFVSRCFVGWTPRFCSEIEYEVLAYPSFSQRDTTSHDSQVKRPASLDLRWLGQDATHLPSSFLTSESKMCCLTAKCYSLTACGPPDLFESYLPQYSANLSIKIQKLPFATFQVVQFSFQRGHFASIHNLRNPKVSTALSTVWTFALSASGSVLRWLSLMDWISDGCDWSQEIFGTRCDYTFGAWHSHLCGNFLWYSYSDISVKPGFTNPSWPQYGFQVVCIELGFVMSSASDCRINIILPWYFW